MTLDLHPALPAVPGYLTKRTVKYAPVGSRRTCMPPPTDTDDDWLLLISDHVNLDNEMARFGWRLGGSMPTDAQPVNPDAQFWSYTKDDANLIVTQSESFFSRFLAATAVCKLLNVMTKRERIRIFQAALYEHWMPQADGKHPWLPADHPTNAGQPEDPDEL